MNTFGNTVAAISTPPGKGGVAVIRISGDSAKEIADRCFLPRDGKTFSSHPPRHAVYGDIIFNGEKTDDGIAIMFSAPNSYTGEDVVEISCHGGVLITQTVLSAVFSAGAIPAGAGEFTRRAFINGRISLSDAEAIGTLLEAKSISQIRLASCDSRNKLKNSMSNIRADMLKLMSTLFAKIDYPDEDLSDLGEDEIVESLKMICEKLDSLIKTYKAGRAINEGINTVICGKPNAGKSTLYNRLTGEESAIVTEYAGTTRDVLHETVSVGGILLNLSDTAGIRDADDPVEKIGVERSRKCIENAELILAVYDGSKPMEQQDRELTDMLSSVAGTVVAVVNKTDLKKTNVSDILKERFENVVELSAREGDITPLTEKISRMFFDGNIQVGADAIIANARQYSAVTRAREYILNSIKAFSSGYACDVASSDLELAIRAVSELDGHEASESIVAEIFSHFCVGK